MTYNEFELDVLENTVPSRKDSYDPSANICAGVRWLFRKKMIASSILGREATWEETVIFYKGYWDEVKAGKIPAGLKKLRDFYNRLEK